MASTIRRTPAIEAPITSERYTSREYLNKEWQKIWPKMWLVAGVASDVEEPGDYFVFNLEPESIIISRTSDNEVAAFYNVCQHRGARVLLSDRGAMEQYTCPTMAGLMPMTASSLTFQTKIGSVRAYHVRSCR